MLKTRLVQGGVRRSIVDDQDLVDGARLPQKRSDRLLDDIGVVEGMNIR